MTPLTPLRRSARAAQALSLLLLPHGGQQRARRNAWAGMSSDAARGRDRRAAETALEAAAHRWAATTARRDGTVL